MAAGGASSEFEEFFDRFDAEVGGGTERGYAIALGRPLIGNRPKDILAYSLNWTHRFMYKYGCPPALASSIARLVSEKEVAADLTPFREEGDSVLMKNGPYFEHVMESIASTVSDLHMGKVGIPSDVKAVLPFPWNTSAHGIRNKRRKMEDQHVILPCIQQLHLTTMAIPETAIFAVFDGHGGPEASDFAAAHLPVDLIRHKLFPTDLEGAVNAVIEEVDKDFLEFTENMRVRCGTTAIVAAIRDKTLHLAWVGDSQAMLSRNGQPAIFTKPHRPSDEEEKQRIHDLGGIVLEIQGSWRVSGQVAVSRAIGDAEQKRYISSKPDSLSVPLDGSEDFLLLACDGVWDSSSITPEMVCEEFREKCKENVSGFAERVVDIAKAGCDDNITAVIVDLRGYVSSCEATGLK